MLPRMMHRILDIEHDHALGQMAARLTKLTA
jgi:hypothetical protein